MNTFSGKLEFRADREWRSFDITLRGFISEEHGGYVIKEVEFKKQENGEYIKPFLSLSEEQAQSLMDALWSVGCRPSEGHGSTGQLAATEKHLEDMRKIAFTVIGTPLAVVRDNEVHHEKM